MKFVGRGGVSNIDWDIIPFHCERVRGKTVEFRDMREVMCFQEDDELADDREEMLVVVAKGDAA